MTKKIIFVSIGILCSLFLTSLQNKPETGNISESNALFSKAIIEMGELVEKKYKFSPIGYGINQPDKITYMEVSFVTPSALTKSEARTILLEATNEFLKIINNDKELKKYLSNYPFTLKNVGIILSTGTPDEVLHPEICMASCTKRGVFFYTHDPKNTMKFKAITSETHEQALSKIAQSQNTAPLKETKTR